MFEDRFVDIVAEGYDAGIRIGEMIAQDMVAVRLIEPSPLTVLRSPAYFAHRVNRYVRNSSVSTPASTSGRSGGRSTAGVQGAIRTRGSAKFFHGCQRPADSQRAGDMHIGRCIRRRSHLQHCVGRRAPRPVGVAGAKRGGLDA